MNTFKQYYLHVKKYWHLALLLAILQPIATYIDTVWISQLYKEVINKMSSPDITLYRYVTTIIWYYAIIFVCWRLIGYVIVVFEAHVKRDIEQRIYQHLLAQSYKFHVNRFSGSLVAQTNRFVNAFERLFDTVYFELFRVALYFIFSTLVLATIHPTIVWLTIAWAIVFIGTNIWLQYKKSSLSRTASAMDSSVTARLADSLSNIFTIKSFAKEKDEQHAFNTISNKRAAAVKLDWFAAEGIFAWQALLMLGFEIYLLKLCIDLVLESKIDVGQVVQVQIVVFPLMRNLWNMGKMIRNIERSLSDSAEMTHILQHAPTIVDHPHAKDNEVKNSTIEFRNVTFGYGKHPTIEAEELKGEALFEHFYLTIPAGQRVGLVGRSGSGKTTLTKLLMRLMDIQDGEILIDGKPLTEYTQESLRQAIAYVPQEPNLFHRPIRENIVYGKHSATNEEVVTAGKKAQAHEFIHKLEKGYDTLVGERGTKLSGGERQRVAIARAILKDAPLIVLDEATSALDSESEEAIQKAFGEILKGKTAVVIAHRLSTIQKLDRIIVLDKGTIIEDGTHEELLKKGGAYAHLWQLQSGGFLQEE